MYEFIERGPAPAEDLKALALHDRGVAKYLSAYERIAARAAAGGPQGIRKLAPSLLSVIADPRMQRAAWDHLVEHGGAAAGPNGDRCADYADPEAWAACRTIGKAIRSGTYRSGDERLVNIRKSSGSGTRPLVLLDIQDRMVQRAAMTVMQPLLDPLFSPLSFGYRPAQGHLKALAAAEAIAVSQGRLVWLVADIKEAFMHVPVSRLQDVLRRFFPADDLMKFLTLLLPGKHLPGLRQGGALSPLMLNLYLHHFFDRPWRSNPANPPLVRVADDMLVLCQSAEEAEWAFGELQRLLQPAGMPLKHTADESIHDLAEGHSARWLGFSIVAGKRRIKYRLTQVAWKRLRLQLELAHTKTDSPLRALRTVYGWLSQRGPAYRTGDRGKVICQRVIDIARQHAFEEMPTLSRLVNRWQLAHARWRGIQQLAIRHNEAREAVSDDE